MENGIELLHNRQISPQTIATFNIQMNESGWVYPVPGGSHRWKNFDSNSQPKYRWEPFKPVTAKLYHAPDIKNQILEADGACWFVSGEADVWAMHSASVRNVLSAFGESYVISDLPDRLRALGVIVVRLAPDLDDTGRNWSEKVAQRLHGSDILLEAFQLPTNLGPKGDLGKAWQDYHQSMPFEQWLLNLPTLELNPQPFHENPHQLEKTQQESVPAGYIKLIIDVLGVKRFKSDGNSRDNVNCPFHDDRIPSASLHREKGLYCHTCSRLFLWQEVGIQLGLGTIRNWKYTLQESNTWQLSTETREALIRNKLTNVSRLFDALYLSGWSPGHTFTVKEAAETCKTFKLSLHSIYKAIRDCEGTYLHLFPTIKELISKEEDFIKKYRPPKRYGLLAPSEVERIMGTDLCKWKHYDLILPEKLANVKKYRAEVYAALPRRRPGEYARRTLAKRIGVSNRTTQDYDKLADLNVIPRIQKRKLTISEASLLPEDRKEMPGNVWLESNGRKFAPTKDGAVRAFKEGNTVKKVEQLANYYGPKQKDTT